MKFWNSEEADISTLFMEESLPFITITVYARKAVTREGQPISSTHRFLTLISSKVAAEVEQKYEFQGKIPSWAFNLRPSDFLVMPTLKTVRSVKNRAHRGT